MSGPIFLALIVVALLIAALTPGRRAGLSWWEIGYRVFLCGFLLVAAGLALAYFFDVILQMEGELSLLLGAVGGLAISSFLYLISLRGARQRRLEEAATAAPAAFAQRSPSPRPIQTTKAPDVFISYKRDERAEVVAIANKLEALKLSVWFDAELRSGTSFDAEIEKQVRVAKCVLVCWSPGAVQSDWVRAEATIGRQRNVLAAALLKSCDLPPPFNLVHTDDLRGGVSASNPDWVRLLDRIGELTGRPGIAAWERICASPDAAAIGQWMAQNANDPLFERAVATLKTLKA